MKIVISNRAYENLKDIFEYISYDSIKYANITINNIYSYIEKLKISPYLGRYVPEIEDKHLLELIYKSYRIVYQVFEDTNTVYIYFIIHGKRNFNSFYNLYLSNR